MSTIHRRFILWTVAGPAHAILGLLAACAPATMTAQEGVITTVVLLRHADRNPLQAGLNRDGMERAAVLPAALEGIAIDAIYTLDIERNRQTAEPLATARRLPVLIVPERDIAKRLVPENRGRTVVWIGNTDNLADIHRTLGGDGPPPDRYGDLFILRVPDRGPTSVTRMIYGRAPAGAP